MKSKQLLLKLLKSPNVQKINQPDLGVLSVSYGKDHMITKSWQELIKYYIGKKFLVSFSIFCSAFQKLDSLNCVFVALRRAVIAKQGTTVIARGVMKRLWSNQLENRNDDKNKYSVVDENKPSEIITKWCNANL